MDRAQADRSLPRGAAPTLSERLQHVGLASEQTHEHYVGLLCQFAPDAVFAYLQARDAPRCADCRAGVIRPSPHAVMWWQEHDAYRVDVCLELCERHGVKDATAYLKERTGDVGGALQVEMCAR